MLSYLICVLDIHFLL